LWCEVTKNGDKLKIKAKPNNTSEARPGNILISSNSKELTVRILQSASNEKLDVAKGEVTFGYTGGKEEITVYGNINNNWWIEKFPNWCLVTKKDDGAIAIECLENTSTKERGEVVLIKTGDNQQVGIKITQRKGIASSTIPIPIEQGQNSKIIGGKNISFGITAGLVMPSFSTDASSDYLGSAVNYAYEPDNEKANYSSGTGFTIGLIADIRLVDNFYFQTGLNYTNINMENKFKGEWWYEEELTNTTYLSGQAYDNFTEKYSLSYLEIPFIFSYRFKLAEKTNWQINMGPYVGYGISGKCKIDGTTDYPSLTEYYYSNDMPTGDTYFKNCKVTGEFDLFGKSGSRKDSYTSGDMPEYDHEFDFDDAPFSKLNYGLSIGTSIEFSGVNLGISYDMGLNNIANDGFWESGRYPISDYNGSEMKSYKHKVNRFQIKLAYIFR
jgi:hypothetical protein